MDRSVIQSFRYYFESCYAIDCWIGETAKEICFKSGKLSCTQHTFLSEFNANIDGQNNAIDQKLRDFYGHHSEIATGTKDKVSDVLDICLMRDKPNREGQKNVLQIVDDIGEATRTLFQGSVECVRTFLKGRAVNVHRPDQTPICQLCAEGICAGGDEEKLKMYQKLNNIYERSETEPGQRLEELCRWREEVTTSSNKVFTELIDTRTNIADSISRLMKDHIFYKLPIFVISHPHGKMKFCSVGKFDHKHRESIAYTTATCTGSSGGLVLPLWPKMECWVEIHEDEDVFKPQNWSSFGMGHRTVHMPHSRGIGLGMCAEMFSYRWRINKIHCSPYRFSEMFDDVGIHNDKKKKKRKRRKKNKNKTADPSLAKT